MNMYRYSCCRRGEACGAPPVSEQPAQHLCEKICEDMLGRSIALTCDVWIAGEPAISYELSETYPLPLYHED